MHLIGDVLDEQLRDSRGKNAGRVDGIVLEVRDDKAPRLAYLEVSPITLLARFNMRIAEWYARFDGRLGEGRGIPIRIPWSRVTREGTVLQMDMEVGDTPINALEDWLSRTIVQRIPGG